MDIHEETYCSQLADVIGADKGEMEELKVQFISCLEPANEKVSPRINDLHQSSTHLYTLGTSNDG
jgi:hypothetical protein